MSLKIPNLPPEEQKDPIGDSAAQNHFIPTNEAGDPAFWKPCGGYAIAANQQAMPVLGTVDKEVQGMPKITMKILDDLQNSVISVSRLADIGLASLFTRHGWVVIDENTLSLNNDVRVLATGKRDEGPGGMYRMPYTKIDEAVNMIQNAREMQPNYADEYVYGIAEANNSSITHQGPSKVRERWPVRGDVWDPSVELGNICHSTENLWHMPTMNTFYSTITYKDTAERVRFWHRALGSPTLSCLAHALNSGILVIPGLTRQDIIDNPPQLMVTAKGHLKNLMKGLGSTKPFKTPPINDEVMSLSDMDIIRKQVPGLTHVQDEQIKSSEWYVRRVQRIAVDTTGKFPVTSFAGYNYILIVQCGQYIKYVPMRARSELGYYVKNAYMEAVRLGHKVTSIMSDNEVAKDTKDFFTLHNVQYNQVAPYNHRANPAERAIQTAKDHFISLLAGRDPACSLGLWHEALHLAEVTLNSLRDAGGGKSAYEVYWGSRFDFIAHPIAPWGTRCEAYVPKPLRDTWGYRSRSMWYVGPSMSNYRAHRLVSIDNESKASVSTAQQVVFLSADGWQAKHSVLDHMMHTVRDLTSQIKAFPNVPPQLGGDVAKYLQAWAEALPTTQEQADQTTVDAWEAGSGPLVWVGDELYDDKGQLVEKLIKPSEQTDKSKAGVSPPPIPTQALNIPAPDNFVPDISSPQTVIPETMPVSEETATSEGVSTSEGGNIISHSNNVIANVVAKISSNTINAKPKKAPPIVHVPMGIRDTRRARQYVLDELAKQIDPEDPEALHIITDIEFCHVLKEKDHKTMNMRSAMGTQDAQLWKQADTDELERMLNLTRVQPLHPEEWPQYVHARNVIKVLEHKVEKGPRVRSAFNGSPIPGKENTKLYSAFASEEMVKKIFWATLATNGKEHGSRHLTADLSSFYLHDRNILNRLEYMFYPTQFLTKEAKAKYASYIKNDRIMLECGQAIYGMPDAGTVSGLVLAKTLQDNGYVEIESSMLWKSTRPGEEQVLFNIHVDDFDFQAIPGQGHFERLLLVLQTAGYTVKHTNFTDNYQEFCGLTIYHDPVTNIVYVAMPDRVQAILEEFNMVDCKIEEHPYAYTRPVYAGTQRPQSQQYSSPLSVQEIKLLQQKIGALQWFTIIGYDVVLALGKVSSQQSKPTKATMKACDHIIRYIAGKKNATLAFAPSNMQVSSESDASFNSETKGRSRAGGIILIGGYDSKGNPVSSPINVHSKIEDCVPASAAEAELVANHDICKKTIYPVRIVTAIGFKQLNATENRSDSECAVGIASGTMQDRKTKHIDRRYYWLQHEIKKGAIKVTWYPGKTNLADTFTKYVDKEVHQNTRNKFMVDLDMSNREGVLVDPPKLGTDSTR